MMNKTNNCPALNADTMNLIEHRLWYQGQEVKGMSVKTKPYRIYNCDSTGHSSDRQHDKNKRENDGKGNGNGNGNDVVKLQGVSFGDLRSTGGNGGPAIATAGTNFSILANSSAIAAGANGGLGGAITTNTANTPISFLDGSLNGNLNGLLNDNLNDNLNGNLNDNFSKNENFSENENKAIDNDGIDVI